MHVIATASVHRPPSGPPPFPRDAARSAGILAAAAAAVVLATLALSVLIVPRPPGPTVATPTGGIEMDLGAAPTAIGGQLVVSGERSGRMSVASAASEPGYEPTPEGIAFVRGDVTLSGPEGDIVVSPGTGEISRIEYDGMSFYLDPGDCTATPGGRSEQLGLMHVRVECPGVADLRGGVVIGLEGIIAVPADAFGDRGNLPATGGTVEVGATQLEIVEGVGIIDGLGSVTDPRVPLVVSGEGESGLAILYDPATDEFALNALQVEGAFTELDGECTLPAEVLGRINPQTSVVRLTIDCAGVPLADGTTGPMTGSLVVDLIDLVSDR